MVTVSQEPQTCWWFIPTQLQWQTIRQLRKEERLGFVPALLPHLLKGVRQFNIGNLFCILELKKAIPSMTCTHRNNLVQKEKSLPFSHSKNKTRSNFTVLILMCVEKEKKKWKAQISYKTACLRFNAITSSTPAYLSDLLHRYSPSRSLRSSADTRLLKIPLYKCKTKGDRAFCYRTGCSAGICAGSFCLELAATAH